MSKVTATIVLTQLLRLHQVLAGHVGTDDGNVVDIPENKTRELLAVRSTDLDWRDEILHVFVWDTRRRLVPVLPQWTAPLVELTIDDDRDRWSFRPGRQGIRSAQVTDFLHRGHQTDLDVRPARMRTTWLLTHLASGTPPRELLRIAGLENLAALDRIVRFLPIQSTATPLD